VVNEKGKGHFFLLQVIWWMLLILTC